MKNYIKWIRSKVGHDCVFLNFAAACITNNKEEILLQKRGDGKGWGFLGGAMELGESAEETVIREVKEESGLDVSVTRLLGVYTKYIDTYPSGDVAQPIVIFFECKLKSNTFDYQTDETIELKFFKRTEIPTLFNKQHNDALQDYLNNHYSTYR